MKKKLEEINEIELEEDKNIVDKQYKRERLFVIIILMLIAIFIIVYLLINYFGIVEHRPRIPTGNVDIFDIVFGGNVGSSSCCTCNNCNGNKKVCCDFCKKNSIECDISCNTNNNNNKKTTNNKEIINNSNNSNNTNNNNNNNNNNDKTNNDENQNDDGNQDNDENQNKVLVYDSDTDYSTDTPLNIFTQTAYYIVDDKIAPLSENSYQFVVRNRNDFSIVYNFEAIETNKYDINMKFRLKQNGKYVVGDDNNYVTADEIEQYNVDLSGNTYDVYTLDWKWFESKNDTRIGEDINSYYKLNLKVTANQY